MTIFIRLLDVPATDRAAALKNAVHGTSLRTFESNLSDFAKVPGTPFGYWVPRRALDAFTRFPPAHEKSRLVASTNPLNADFRFVRAWWEIGLDTLNEVWRPWAKGGAYSPFYYDIDTVIRWSDERRTYEGFLGTENRPLERPASLQHFFRPGLTWPRRTNGLSFRLLPKGSIFADKGPAIFIDSDDEADLMALCALMNSTPFRYLVGVQLARTELAQSYEVGLIQQTPIPDIEGSDRDELASLAHRAWVFRRSLDLINEQSHAFILPAVILKRRMIFNTGAVERDLAAIAAKIDEIAFRLYGFSDVDSDTIRAWTRRHSQGNREAYRRSVEDDQATEEDDSGTRAVGEIALLSWAVGVAFRRFDIRLATGERALPQTAGAFDPLPAMSPAMLREGETCLPKFQGVLVDDPGHQDDLTARVLAIFERVADVVPESENVRRALAREFFSAHIRMYSKSRRRAPVYWQLSTPTGSYAVWLYVHAFNRDTLFRVQSDYVEPKLAHEQRQLDALRAEANQMPTSAQRRAIEAQETFIEELQALLDEVRRVAPLWSPDLNDGVIINFSPLWRMVPQNRAWQRDLRSTWDALVAGDHDWAHLAMHLWPERVVPKCAIDRSLAIAHTLEDVFWLEEDEKWKSREEPLRPIDEIVKERTSPAVKDALKSLLEAPETSGASRRSRRRAA